MHWKPSVESEPTSPPSPPPVAGWRRAVRGFGAYEWMTFSYLALLNLLILAFSRNLERPWLFFGLHLALGAVMVALVWTANRWPSAEMRFARHWYPLAMFIFFFEELHYLAHLIFPRWFDAELIALERAVFGVHPTVWLQQFANPVLTDGMQFAYLTYYLYTLIIAGVLYARAELEAFWVTMNSTALAYIFGYLIALLLPMEGPAHTLAALHTSALTGGPFTAAVNFIQGFGRIHGAAFPSLHAAGAAVAVLAAWRYRRRLFWIFLPFFLAMLLGAVYTRFHYFSDMPAGVLVGVAGFWLGQRLKAPAEAGLAGFR